MKATICHEKLPTISELRYNSERIILTGHERNDKKTETTQLTDDANEPAEEILSENVTVKFRFNETQIIAQVYPNDMTLSDIKKDLAQRFEVPADLLIIKQCNHILNDQCVIRDTNCNTFGIHEYDLLLATVLSPEYSTKNLQNDFCYGNFKSASNEIQSDIKEYTLDVDVYYSKQRLPDFIKVFIPAEDSRTGKAKNIVVEIQNKAIVKPILCSYRNKHTGTEYMDAYTQTGPHINKCTDRRYVSRDTQTYELKMKQIDTMHDQTSQCWLDGNNVRFWSEYGDYEITAGKYKTHSQITKAENKMAKIKLIQRNFRRFKWTRWFKEWAKEYRRRVKNRIADEEAFLAEQMRRISREQRAKQFPRTKNDFDMLLYEVQKWKIAEMKRITNLYEGPTRIAAINILLDKEIEMLNGIEKQRNLVFKSMEDFRLNQLLKKMGEPIKWVGYGNTMIHMDLLRTQRVRFLTEIYEELQKPLPKLERIQLINKVREILLNETCYPKFPELYQLFDREKNLLMYALHADVGLLRKRQNILFIELIKFTEEPLPTRQDCRMCTVCKCVKPYSQFAIRTNQKRVDTCNKCYSLKVSSVENQIYASILRAIQREERRKRCNGSFAFILQIEDVRHLIKDIWHGHSILSKCENLQRLRLPRWRKNEEWSPWNCVCLTEHETRNHNRLENLEDIYDKKLLLEVDNRQKLARSAFHNLTAVSVEFTETGRWWKVGLNKQRVVKLDDLTSHQGADKIIKRDINEFNYRIGKIL